MILNPIFLGGVWFIIHRYSVFHTFHLEGVGGWSEPNETNLLHLKKTCHILRRSLREMRHIKIDVICINDGEVYVK